MRNPEFGVGHLEKWAEMLQILKDIANNRMPSVADLLKQSAQAPKQAQAPSGNKTAQAGQVRSVSPGKAGTGEKKAPRARTVNCRRRIVATASEEERRSKPSTPAKPPTLKLPVTCLPAAVPSPVNRILPPTSWMRPWSSNKIWLAEFEKSPTNSIACSPISKGALWWNTEGRVAVQYRIAGRLGDQVTDAFGVAPSRVTALRPTFERAFRPGDQEQSRHVETSWTTCSPISSARRLVQDSPGRHGQTRRRRLICANFPAT